MLTVEETILVVFFLSEHTGKEASFLPLLHVGNFSSVELTSDYAHPHTHARTHARTRTLHTCSLCYTIFVLSD